MLGELSVERSVNAIAVPETVRREPRPDVHDLYRPRLASSVARNGPVQRTVDQRSNIIVQPWRDTSLGSTSLRVKP